VTVSKRGTYCIEKWQRGVGDEGLKWTGDPGRKSERTKKKTKERNQANKNERKRFCD